MQNGFQVLCFIVFSIAVQILLYWFCAKGKLKWLDFFVFAFSLFANAWLFPKFLLSQPDPKGDCTFSSAGMGQLFFLFFGLSSTIIVFIVNGYLRKGQK